MGRGMRGGGERREMGREEEEREWEKIRRREWRIREGKRNKGK